MPGRLRKSAPVVVGILFAAMLVLPLVHRLEHGLAHARLAEAIARDSGHVHADSPSFSRALADASHESQQCVVCTTLVQAMAVSSAEGRRDVRRAEGLGVVREMPVSSPISSQSTRAPPADS